MLQDFKEFALKGNVLDLAVGVIIGTAFGTVVNALVNDILMPPFGLILGKVNFTNLYFNLSGKSYPNLVSAQTAGAPIIAYGLFLNAIINFLVVSFALYLTIHQINKLRRNPTPPPEDKKCPFCQTNIPLLATKCPNCTSPLTKLK